MQFRKSPVKAFTLIELLVVIAIIALLLSIITPALRKVKQKASMILCLNNQKNIILAWQVYSSDNNNELVNGYCHQNYMRLNNNKSAWVEPPQTQTGAYKGTYGDATVTLEDRKRGLEQGLLYDYLKDTAVFHCPGDTRLTRGNSLGTGPAFQIYRTYGFADGISVDPDRSAGDENTLKYRTPKKINEIKGPANKYVLIEAAYTGAACNFNDASWNFFPYNPAGSEQWWDPLGLYHSDACTMSFSDAHAESYVFRDERTVKYFQDRANPSSQPGNEDIIFFQQGWPGIRIN
jgi:prepilin-type N-terminal cleavage/methylation domain-containing protein